MAQRPHVVIVGGGFGGLTCAQSLADEPVDVTLIDSRNHHLFQPLLYQVAMAGLSPAEIAAPIRSVLHEQRNASVLLAEVEAVDLTSREVKLVGAERDSLRFDYLVLAAGAQNHYFGHDDWARYAVGLKDLDDAVEIRRRVLVAFEAAECMHDPVEQKRLLTFVVVGGGPTGVELAGALGELARVVLARDFRRINPASAQVILLEGGERILTSFPEKLSKRATRDLAGLGVEVRAGTRVTRIDETGVFLGDQHIPSATVLWAAGVRASDLTRGLGVPLDRTGRVLVQADLTLPNHPSVFAVGDMTSFLHQGGSPLPGTSPVAMQQARHVAHNVMASLRGQPMLPFQYVDKGSMATIGRAAAVAQLGSLKLGGFLAWLLWLAVHIFFLITFRNRFAVLFNWAYSYFTYKRGARLITGHRLTAGPSRSSLALAPVAESAPPPAPTGSGPQQAPPR
ncbi:MAG: NAD(P)/FAD-dependent oxidoreductase [Myxococcales bacterium]|nr:NAD(P)/FAD-dependent oxidoreductase [Myxococcales bacterium]